MNPNRKGQAGSPVSAGMQSASVTPFANTHFILPYGLRLQQTINAGTTSVTIPTGITFVYAICVGGGGAAGGSRGGGGAGGVAWGWTLANTECVVGSGGIAPSGAGGYTRYGNVIAGGGGGGGNTGTTGSIGGGGGGGTSGFAGSTNYWGVPGGNAPSGIGAGGGGGGTSFPLGGSGISGGGGVSLAGGSGLVGGGAGSGTGGFGINILTGVKTGYGLINTGGGGIAESSSTMTGGLGGGGGTANGSGGAGILYLFY